MADLEQLLATSAAFHHHYLCPRQVLGVRMGLLAGRVLGLDLPQADKRLLTIVETDGCVADGIAVATGCWVGGRTLRVEDYGKVAATFVDTLIERAIRMAPRHEVRKLAPDYAPEAKNRGEAYLLGYQRMLDNLLFSWQEVTLVTPLVAILSRPGRRVNCRVCGEEIMNEREMVCEGSVFCQACAGFAYYNTSDSREGDCDLERELISAPANFNSEEWAR